MSEAVAAPEKPTAPAPPPSLREETAEPKKRPYGLIILAIVLVVGGFFGVRMYLYNSSHITTDDAYVTMDVVPVNAQVSGSVVSVPVSENQLVKAGDLLAQLDDRTFKADVDQAQANLAVAEANARSANADVGLTTQTGQAQVSEAQSGVAAGVTDVATARANVQKAVSGVAIAQATYSSALAQAKAADDNVQTQIADRARMVQQLAGFKAAITNAQAAVRVAQANLANAQATASNAERDAQRYRDLATQGAVPTSQAEARETAAANARAAVDAAQQQVAAAQAGVNQRQADYSAAQQQIKWADSSISTAKANARAAHQTADAQGTRIGAARSDVAVAQEGVRAAQAHQTANVGKLSEAQALPKRLTMSEAAKAQAIAKVQQAQAALAAAQIALQRTRIVATVPGRVSKKTGEVGQQVTPGQPLMSLIPVETPWIVANFKETQMGSIRTGQPVEIDVDAIPGHTFKGHVNSVSAGTGSTFALLPADNATGNFTKVVQRVPVKITFDPGQPDLDRLSAGLSTNVAIVIK